MAATYRSVSNAAAQTAGTTTTASTVAITPTMPAGAAAGDRIFVFQSFATAATSAATPANWTALYKDVQVLTGAASAGGGLRRISCYYRDYDGVWTMPSFALTSTAQNTHAIAAIAVQKAVGDAWDTPTASANGEYFPGTPGTAYSATTSSNFTTNTGALLMAHSVLNDVAASSSTSITGVNQTFASVTERADGGLATGNDVHIAVDTATVSAGGTGTLTRTATLVAASQGGTCFVQQTVHPTAVRSALASVPASGPTNRTVTKPAGVVDGDILVCIGISDSVNTAHIVPSAGWSAALIDSQSGASFLEFRVFTKTASSEGASWTFTTAATADVAFVVVALLPTDIDTNTANWVKQAAASWATSDAPSLSGAGLLLLCAACGKPASSGTRTWTPPAGMTELAEGSTVWVSVDVAALDAPPNPTLTRTFTPSAAVGTGATTVSILIPSASAGTDFTADDDDAVGVTDDMAKDAGRTITDPVGVTDGLTKDAGRTITDVVGLTDALAKDSGRSVTDPVGLTDALSKDVGRTATDPVGLSDALTKVADYAREQTDAISVTDALVKDVGRTALDTVGVTDAVGLSADWDRVVSEQVGLTDTAEFAQTFARQPADTVGITDAASFSADVVVETTDQVGVTDSIELSAGEDVAAVDAVEITDEASFDMGETVDADDQVGISDDISLDTDYDRSVTDAIGVTDSLLAEGGLAREETDDVELTDSLEMSADWSPTFTDDIGITDAEIFVLIPAGDLSAIDLVGISDEAIFSIETAHEADDSVDVTDEAAWEQGRSVIDSVGLSDTAIFDISGESEWTDEVGITDSAQFDAADIHVTDLVGLTDGFTLSGIAENRMLVAEPENRMLVAEAENRMLVAEPENRTLVAEPEDRMLVAEPEDRLLRAAEQRTLTADDGIP